MYFLCCLTHINLLPNGSKNQAKIIRAKIKNKKDDCLSLPLFPLIFPFLIHTGIFKPGPISVPLFHTIFCSYVVLSLLYFVSLWTENSLSTYLESIMLFISLWKPVINLCDIFSPSFCPRSIPNFWIAALSISLLQNNQQFHRKAKVMCNIEQRCWSRENGRMG